MSPLEQALLPEMPEASWIERARFIMELTSPPDVVKEAGTKLPLTSTIIAAAAGGLLGGASALTSSGVARKRREFRSLQEMRDGEGVSPSKHEISDWIADHPWAVAALGGALGAGASGGIRRMQVGKLYNSFGDAPSRISSRTPVPVVKTSSLDTYLEDRAREDVVDAAEDVSWEKVASVLDSLSEDGLRELDVLLSVGALTPEDLVKEAGWLDGPARLFAARGGKRSAKYLEESLAKRLASPGFSAKSNAVVNSEYELRRLSGLGTTEAGIAAGKLQSRFAKQNTKLTKTLNQLDSDAHLARVGGREGAGIDQVDDLLSQQRNVLRGAPSVGPVRPGAPEVSSFKPPDATKDVPGGVGNHLKRNWPWYAAGAGGFYLASKMGEKPPEEEGGFEVQSSAGATKQELRERLGLTNDLDKEAGALGTVFRWAGRGLERIGLSRLGGTAAVRQAARYGDDAASGLAATRVGTHLSAGQAAAKKAQELAEKLKGFKANPEGGKLAKSTEKAHAKAVAAARKDLDLAETNKNLAGLAGKDTVIDQAAKAKLLRQSGRVEQGQKKLLDRATKEVITGNPSPARLNRLEAANKSFESRAKSLKTRAPDGAAEEIAKVKAQLPAAPVPPVKVPAVSSSAPPVAPVAGTPPKGPPKLNALPMKTKKVVMGTPPNTPVPGGAPAVGAKGAKKAGDPGFWEGLKSTSGYSFAHPFRSAQQAVTQADNPAFTRWAKKNPKAALGKRMGRFAGATAYGAGGLYATSKVFGGNNER